MKSNAISLSAVRLFTEVSQAGSFAATARDKGLDPSLVSRQIAALEDALGFRLFDRNTRRLNLTEAGRHYLDRCGTLLDEFEAAREEATDLISAPRGVLRITASVAFGERWLTPRLASFCDAYPDISVELLLTDAMVDIAAENIDVALRLAPRPDGAFVATKLMDTAYRVVASPSYLERSGRLSDPRELAHHPCLRLSLPGHRSLWRFRRVDTVHEVPVDGRMMISNPLALRRAALTGMGPAMLADWIVDEDIADGRLEACLPDWEVSAAAFDTAAWILYPAKEYVPAKTRAFIDHLKVSVREAEGSQDT